MIFTYNQYQLIQYLPIIDMDIKQIIVNLCLIRSFKAPLFNHLTAHGFGFYKDQDIIYNSGMIGFADAVEVSSTSIHIKNKLIEAIYFYYGQGNNLHEISVDFEYSNIDPQHLKIYAMEKEIRIYRGIFNRSITTIYKNNDIDGLYQTNGNVTFIY